MPFMFAVSERGLAGRRLKLARAIGAGYGRAAMRCRCQGQPDLRMAKRAAAAITGNARGAGCNLLNIGRAVGTGRRLRGGLGHNRPHFLEKKLCAVLPVGNSGNSDSIVRIGLELVNWQKRRNACAPIYCADHTYTTA